MDKRSRKEVLAGQSAADMVSQAVEQDIIPFAEVCRYVGEEGIKVVSFVCELLPKCWQCCTKLELT